MTCKLTNDIRRQWMQPGPGILRMVLDTDTYNEIDDQFALVYSLLSPERLKVEAIHAAPFLNARSTGPGDGMEKSHEEILRLLAFLKRPSAGFVFRGATRFLDASLQPCASDATADLIARAMQPSGSPLYVVAIGAITNVASAILLQPEIVNRIVVVWLGGHALNWPDTREFNLQQDPYAARVVFDSGVPVIHIPCNGVASHLHTSVPEIETHVRGKGPLGDYLADIFAAYHTDHFAWSKVIWDMAPVGYLLREHWVPSRWVPSPVITQDIAWDAPDEKRPVIRSAFMVHRDGIFRDFFTKLAARCNP